MFQMLFSLPRILAAPSIHPCLLSTDEPSYHLKCHILVVLSYCSSMSVTLMKH